MSAPATVPDSGGRGDAAAGTPAETHARGFDLAAAWELNPKVALRPSRSARCCTTSVPASSFLKNLTVVGIVQSLAEQPSGRPRWPNTASPTSSGPSTCRRSVRSPTRE